MEEINIEKIMEEIRQEIQEKGYTNDMLSFDDITDFDEENKTLEDYFDILNSIWNVQAYRELPGGNGLVSKLNVFIKKVLRKLIKFYIEPIVADQNEFNANCVRLLNMINGHMNIKDKKIEMLEEEIEQLKKQIKSSQNG